MSPFVSQKQRALFYARPELRKHIKKWEAETPKGKLPEHVKKKKKGSRRRQVLMEQMRGGKRGRRGT